ncbi:Hsp20/alpha crystallin family protein [Streptomyces sp. NPDC001276]|uniref:Hsp20/alpha crystallin family protein n=1 Tax=Streptomyces sp. NPDC001276 TaxID=3364555 RepID=UPI0036A6AC6E
MVEAELPGIEREDIDVEIGDRDLCITGGASSASAKASCVAALGAPAASSTARCSRPTSKPKITATLADGVLTVTVPKAQAAKPRHIEITQT